MPCGSRIRTGHRRLLSGSRLFLSTVSSLTLRTLSAEARCLSERSRVDDRRRFRGALRRRRTSPLIPGAARSGWCVQPQQARGPRPAADQEDVFVQMRGEVSRKSIMEAAEAEYRRALALHECRRSLRRAPRRAARGVTRAVAPLCDRLAARSHPQAARQLVEVVQWSAGGRRSAGADAGRLSRCCSIWSMGSRPGTSLALAIGLSNRRRTRVTVTCRARRSPAKARRARVVL